MRNLPKRIFGVSLAVLMTAAAVSGCSAPEPAQPTLTAPGSVPVTLPQEPTIPMNREEPMIPVTRPVEGNADQVAQIRLYNVRSGWMNAFDTDQGAFLIADSVQSLLDGLSSRGIDTSNLDLSTFDAAFFADNRLVVIPRSTGSGSVRFSARIEKTSDGVKITPVGTMPEVGTADMADWLVLVSLSKAEFSGTVTVENAGNVIGTTQRYAIHRY